MSGVLVIEDNPSIRELIELLLEDEAWPVTAAYAWGEAQAWLRQETPDLVITDWLLPDLSGADLVRRLRQSLPATTPILVLSAANDAAYATQIGASEFLAKPFDPDELIECVKRLLGQRQAEGLP